MSSPSRRTIFSLAEATDLLPTVKRLTAEAVREADDVSDRLRELDPRDPDHATLSAQLSGIVANWAAAMHALQLEAKGLWLVDFDNGEGYYCWSYPEDTISHFHGYDDGFAGRMKIV
jgi:hypothetical protein